MGLFGELKRRNVFRVGFAYLIVGWLVIQVADIVLENIGAPDWVMQALMLILGLGIIVALFFAWAFEVTPEGLKRESEVDRSQSITGVTGRKLDRSITVFLVIALAYFVWESRVADRSDVVEQVAVETVDQAPAANILEGGIQRSGNQVRINVQLIDAVSDEHLWAEIYDRKLTAENLFAIQSEISKAIANALQATLSPEEQEKVNAVHTRNLEAYESYLHGRKLWTARTAESNARDYDGAEVDFLRAIELSPNHLPSYNWYAISLGSQG